MFGRYLAASCLAVAVIGSAAHAEPQVVGALDGDPIYKLLPPDRIPAIQTPAFITGGAADAQMSPNEPVLGVVIDGEAHAYSLWQLDAHEIVNDRIGDVAFAATW